MMKKKPKMQSPGFTLIELVIAIAVMAILIALAVPSLQDLIRNNRVAGQSNELVAMISFARNEAIRRNVGTDDPVAVELTQTADGWSGIVIDPDGEGAEGCVAANALRCAENTQVELNDNVTLNFNNRGYLRSGDDAWTPEVLFLTHESCGGDRQRRRVEIRPTGQITSCAVGCTDTETTC